MDCDCGEIPTNRVRLLSFARARQTVSESVSALQAGCLSSSFWTRLQRHMSSRTLLLLLERARRPSASVLGRDYLLVTSAVSCLHSASRWLLRPARPGRARGESVREAIVDGMGARFPVLSGRKRSVAGAGLSGARFCLRGASWQSRVCEQWLEGASERLDGRAF